MIITTFLNVQLPITVKPVNQGHPMEKYNMIFIDKWSLFGCYFFIKEGLLKSGLYSKVAFNTSLTVYIAYILYKYLIFHMTELTTNPINWYMYILLRNILIIYNVNLDR